MFYHNILQISENSEGEVAKKGGREAAALHKVWVSTINYSIII